LLDKLTPSFGSWPGMKFDVPADILSGAQTVMQQIQAAFVNQISTLIDGFIGGMQNLVTSTEQFGNVALATILGEAKDLILAVVRIVGGVVEKVLTFFGNNLEALKSALFDARIDISLAQALYDLINPGSSEPLTVLGLGSLLCAFPATTLYRLLFGAAPFPHDADVAANRDLVISGFLQTFLWGLTDILLDMLPKEQPAAFVTGSLLWVIFFQFLIQYLAQPVGAGKPVGDATWAAWGLGFGSPAFKILWLFAFWKGSFAIKGGPRGDPVRGTPMLCLLGVVGLAMNVIALSSKTPPPSPEEIIAGVCGPLSAIGKPGFFLAPPWNLWFLGIVDAVSDAGAGIAKIVLGYRKGGAELAPAAGAAREAAGELVTRPLSG
jgi:hypothetical protein